MGYFSSKSLSDNLHTSSADTTKGAIIDPIGRRKNLIFDNNINKYTDPSVIKAVRNPLPAFTDLHVRC